MAWGTAASFVALYMRRARPRKSSRVWNVSSRAELPQSTESLTALRSPELRTQPMVPPSTVISRQRSERRIAVRLPLKVSGRDSRGFAFEEDTSSENLCRNGAAFVTRFDVAIGSDLEIRILTSFFCSGGSSDPPFHFVCFGGCFAFLASRLCREDPLVPICVSIAPSTSQ